MKLTMSSRTVQFSNRVSAHMQLNAQYAPNNVSSSNDNITRCTKYKNSVSPHIAVSVQAPDLKLVNYSKIDDFNRVGVNNCNDTSEPSFIKLNNVHKNNVEDGNIVSNFSNSKKRKNIDNEEVVKYFSRKDINPNKSNESQNINQDNFDLKKRKENALENKNRRDDKQPYEYIQELLALDRYKMGITNSNFDCPMLQASGRCIADEIKLDKLDVRLQEIQWELQERNKKNWANCLKFTKLPDSLSRHYGRYFSDWNQDEESQFESCSMPNNLKASRDNFLSAVTSSTIVLNNFLNSEPSLTTNNKIDNMEDKKAPCLTIHDSHISSDNDLRKEKLTLIGGREVNNNILEHLTFMHYLHSLKGSTCFICAKSSCPKSLNCHALCKSGRCFNCGNIGHSRRNCRHPDILVQQMLALQNTVQLVNIPSNLESFCINCGRKDHQLCGYVPEPNGLWTLKVRNTSIRNPYTTRHLYPHLFDGGFVWTSEAASNYLRNVMVDNRNKQLHESQSASRQYYDGCGLGY